MKVLLWILQKLMYRKTRNAHIMAFLRYNSLTKLKNLLHNEYERKRKKIILSSKPFLINSEPGSYCNFHCPFCPTGKHLPRERSQAEPEMFQKLFNQIGKYCYLITLHGWGEPLLNKNLPQLIRTAHQHRIFTVVSTNGSLLKPDPGREIISSGLDLLCISIDGIASDSYSKYRYGGHFESVLENLKEFVNLKKEMKSSTPFIEWQFLVFRHNEHELAEAKKLASEIGVDNLVFLPAYTENPDWDASDPSYRLPKGSPLSKPSDCKHLWRTLTFHSNGDIVPCCYDYEGKVPFGNLNNDSLEDFWNNEHFQDSREVVTTGNISQTQHLCCNSCLPKE